MTTLGVQAGGASVTTRVCEDSNKGGDIFSECRREGERNLVKQKFSKRLHFYQVFEK